MQEQEYEQPRDHKVPEVTRLRAMQRTGLASHQIPQNHPEIHKDRSSPMIGKAPNKEMITCAPQ